MHPGERIRDFRKKKGFNQPDFAKSIGYSNAYLAEIELGKKIPSRRFSEKLFKIYGLSTDYVMYGIGEETERFLITQDVKSSWEIHPTANKKLLDNVREILESGDKDLVIALGANIKAFLRTAKASKEKRAHQRCELRIPVDCEIIDKSDIRPVKILNASQMGLLIQSPHDISVGSKIGLKISFLKEVGPESFRARAEIVWKDRKRLNDAEEWQYGIKLIEVQNEGLSKLESLLRGEGGD